MKQEDEKMSALERACLYMRRLAGGADPFTGRPAADVLREPELVKCFAYVTRVLERDLALRRLEQTYRTDIPGEAPPQEQAPKRPQRHIKPLPAFTAAQIAAIEVTDAPITRTVLAARVNAGVDRVQYRRVPRRLILQWLTRCGFLTSADEQQRKFSFPTPQGEAIGIRMTSHTGPQGDIYGAPVFGREAQQFVADNLPQIVASEDLSAEEVVNDAFEQADD